MTKPVMIRSMKAIILQHKAGHWDSLGQI